MDQEKCQSHGEADIQASIERACAAYLAEEFTDVRIHILDALGRMKSDKLDMRIQLHLLFAHCPEGTMKDRDKDVALQDANIILCNRNVYDALCRYDKQGRSESDLRIAESQYLQAHLIRILLSQKGKRGADAEIQEFRGVQTAQTLLGKGGLSKEDAINAHLYLVAQSEDQEIIHRHLCAIEELRPPLATLCLAYTSPSDEYYRQAGIEDINRIAEKMNNPLLRAKLVYKKLRVVGSCIDHDIAVSNRVTIRKSMEKTMAELDAIPEAIAERAWGHVYLLLLELVEEEYASAASHFRIAEHLAGMFEMQDLSDYLETIRETIESDEREFWKKKKKKEDDGEECV